MNRIQYLGLVTLIILPMSIATGLVFFTDIGRPNQKELQYEEAISEEGSTCIVVDKVVLDGRYVRLIECDWSDGTKSKCIIISLNGQGTSCKISGDL